ncbi:MAG: ATP-dependent endonuclease [Bacteroidetes bacterium]|nr:MAG: ATP-dependent endonuclease [Bacteroidota bacterium]
MNAQQFTDIFLDSFPYEPTTDQHSLVEKLSDFILAPQVDALFVLKGYAGTGKTTVVSNLVNVLPTLKAHSVLLAPTGRAAKVISSYSGKPAYTIHRKIYRLTGDADGNFAFKLLPNKHVNTLFIVDEASMIGNQNLSEESSLFGTGNLLNDLISYVYSGENCRLILIGDTAQLPPVGSTESPALNIPYLKSLFHFKIWSAQLRDVVRQEADSGILHNATLVRSRLQNGEDSPGFIKFSLKNFRDIRRAQGTETMDYINDAFSSRNFGETIVVCRSNKRANLYNTHIRQRVLFKEEEISAGDLLMIVKNNYFWLPEQSAAGFIANGDIAEVRRIQRIEELYGFRFAHVTIKLIDYPDQEELDVIIFLDTLSIDGPAFTYQQTAKLFEEISQDYLDEPLKSKRLSKIKKNPYLNALQVKFAYALTCHKAQGGQWQNVFVEMGYIPSEKPDTEYYRWLYTALTRATKNLYLMGFSDDFFVEEKSGNTI